MQDHSGGEAGACSQAAVSLESLTSLAVFCGGVGCSTGQFLTFKMLEFLSRLELVSVNTLIDMFMHWKLQPKAMQISGEYRYRKSTTKGTVSSGHQNLWVWIGTTLSYPTLHSVFIIKTILVIWTAESRADKCPAGKVSYMALRKKISISFKCVPSRVFSHLVPLLPWAVSQPRRQSVSSPLP